MLIVWPDDRYTLHYPDPESGSPLSAAISSHEADEIICSHVLSSERGILAAGLTGAFLKAAEGLRALACAEHEMQEERARRERERRGLDRIQDEES